jgi:antitoxin (DNA-binding transcriptional repressor) of toxin-antitoxin stability system
VRYAYTTFLNCMSKDTVTVRDLRNQFPKVRKLVEAAGEVVLTENGRPRYRLSLYTPAVISEAPPVDYWARLSSWQPEPLTEEQARLLHEENRGGR